MKRKNVLLLLLSLMLATAACHTQKKAMVYNFPVAMSPSIRAGYTELCEKGRVLYDKTCARCHNVRIKGKQVIPDFSAAQLNGYAIRVSNKRHESSMPDSLVSVEDLSLITTFLIYKPKSAIAVR